MTGLVLEACGLGLAGAGLAFLWQNRKLRIGVKFPPRQEFQLPSQPGWTQVPAPPMEFQLHLTRLGQYRVEGLLGEGGMARVYRAHCDVSGRTVALKVIKAEVSQVSEFAQRFHREIEIMKMLKHPNLVEVYGSGADDQCYLAMELVDGPTLEALLKHRRLEFGEFQSLARQMLKGLQFAHDRQMYHRDIKPANYLVARDGVCKLLDFGLALEEGQSRFTVDGFCMGTPAYMAPEVLLKGVYGASSDQYALGVVFYEMLTGQCPFSCEDPMKLGLMHVKMAVPPLRALRTDVSEEWQALVHRMLEKDPSRRFSNLDEVAKAL